jgi:hypothetical protein
MWDDGNPLMVYKPSKQQQAIVTRSYYPQGLRRRRPERQHDVIPGLRVKRDLAGVAQMHQPANQQQMPLGKAPGRESTVYNPIWTLSQM